MSWAGIGSPQWANQPGVSAAVIRARPAVIAASNLSRVRAPVRRKAVLSLLKACSIGVKSGEYGGSYRS